MKYARFKDITQRSTVRRVTSQKSADLIYIEAEA
jgi:hypothetical protein